MIQSYKKLLEMESVASLKLEQDKKALDSIKNILYQNKSFIINKLTQYLKQELNTEYYQYMILDIDNNIFDVLIKKDSEIFESTINGKDYIDFSSDDLIDKRIFNNLDEIILLDYNCSDNLINLSYLCDSLEASFLSYSDYLKEKLSTFVNYVIHKNMYTILNK